MLSLKPLSKDAIPAALAKAEKYLLFNEPWQSESICRDVLEVDSGNQPALIALVLALAAQFDQGISVKEAWDAVGQLTSEYERTYYSGFIQERRAIAVLRQGDLRAGSVVHTLFRQAMDWYEKAAALRPPANDDALLRWNACARVLRRNPHIAPAATHEESAVVGLE
jgi:hypothetical protein